MYPIFSEDSIPTCCSECDNLKTGVEEYPSGESTSKWWCKWNIIMPVVKHSCGRYVPRKTPKEEELARLEKLFS